MAALQLNLFPLALCSPVGEKWEDEGALGSPKEVVVDTVSMKTTFSCQVVYLISFTPKFHTHLVQDLFALVNFCTENSTIRWSLGASLKVAQRLWGVPNSAKWAWSPRQPKRCFREAKPHEIWKLVMCFEPQNYHEWLYTWSIWSANSFEVSLFACLRRQVHW